MSTKAYNKIKQLKLPDQVLAYRYAYYVKGVSIISDYDYDMLEAKVFEMDDPGIPSVGSDLESSYPQRIINLVNNLLP